METDVKTFEVKANLSALAKGIVEGYAAIFGNVDDQDDRMHPGSFTKTIQERGTGMPVTFDHQLDSYGEPVVDGVTLDIREVPREELPPDVLAKAPGATGGLFVQGQLARTRKNQERMREIKSRGGIVPLSFRYRTIKAEVKSGLREIYEVAMAEWGPQLLDPPANRLAYASVKSNKDGEKPDEVEGDDFQEPRAEGEHSEGAAKGDDGTPDSGSPATGDQSDDKGDGEKKDDKSGMTAAAAREKLLELEEWAKGARERLEATLKEA